MVVARRFGNLVLTLALTFYPLSQERKSPLHVFIVSADHPAIPALVFPRTRRTILPLRRETGERAGVRWRVIQINWWLAARSGRTQGPGQKANGQRLGGPGPDWPQAQFEEDNYFAFGFGFHPNSSSWMFNSAIFCKVAIKMGVAPSRYQTFSIAFSTSW